MLGMGQEGEGVCVGDGIFVGMDSDVAEGSRVKADGVAETAEATMVGVFVCVGEGLPAISGI
jgi:hypothetical protein